MTTTFLGFLLFNPINNEMIKRGFYVGEKIKEK